jgi:hypothetical protein
MGLDRGDWVEVFILVLVLGTLIVLVGAWVAMRVESALARSKREVVAAHQEFLRRDYARLAGESEVTRQEMQGLIREVTGLALVVKEARLDPDWDPEPHLAHLRSMDAQITALSPAPPRI